MSSANLRPANLTEFAGQHQLVRDLNILLGAARERRECPDHILLAGPPGLGKTTLANIVAQELALPMVSTSAPAIAKPGDLLALLTGINTPSVVFVDEIHALERRAEELLYTAMEDGHVDMIIGEGVNARTIRLELQPFTLIGATTQMGMLSAPLRGRFGFLGRLVPYTDTELAGIITRSAGVLGVTIDIEAASVIARRSQGTPRIATAGYAAFATGRRCTNVTRSTQQRQKRPWRSSVSTSSAWIPWQETSSKPLSRNSTADPSASAP